jgi:23S rRNA pseudouridine2605 synthase
MGDRPTAARKPDPKRPALVKARPRPVAGWGAPPTEQNPEIPPGPQQGPPAPAPLLAPASPPASPPAPPPALQRVRLQRVLAEAGVAARRKAEQLIVDGRVEVNGQLVRTLPAFVDPARDRIVVEGRELPRLTLASALKPRSNRAQKAPARPSRGTARAEGDENPHSAHDLQAPEHLGSDELHPHADAPSAIRKVYLLLNKPERVLTAAADPGGRSTVMDLAQYPTPVRLFPVGRLEFAARGLVLITNDGPLANLLTHARFGIPKVYEARVKGLMPPDYVADLQRGLSAKAQRAAFELGKRAGTIELELAGVKRVTQGVRQRGPKPPVTIERGNDPYDKTVLRITVRGPLHTPLDELMASAGVKISQLIQVGLGPLALHELRLGEWRELARHEVAALRRLGAKAQQSQRGQQDQPPRPSSRPSARPPRPAR